jgi:hypothetical protein
VDTSSLTTEECRAIEVLLEDWKDLLRCTAIHQAMERAGLPFSHPSRLRVAEFLIADATASGLMRWAPSTYVLTNDEKLVARHDLRLWQPENTAIRPRNSRFRLNSVRRAAIRAAEEQECSDDRKSHTWRNLRQSPVPAVEEPDCSGRHHS